MIEPKKIQIDGMLFYMQPLPALTAARLDKRVITLILPSFGDLDKNSLESLADMDMGVLLSKFSKSLESIEDSSFTDLIIQLFRGTQYMSDDNAQPQDMDEEKINHLFRAKLITLYKVMFEVMRFNKFTPFELVGGGLGMIKIDTLKEQIKKQKKAGKKLGTSANLLET